VGNPVACAAGLAVLDVIEQERLIERAAAIGDRLVEGWRKIAAQSAGAIREVRGLGSMVGVELHNAAVAARIVEGARRRGVLLLTAGEDARVIRHLMPLVTTDAQLDEAFGVFEAATEEALRVASRA
jgi:4-aminobutyrate aminotransferase-like enzyme